MSDVLELSRFRVAESGEREFRASYGACASALEEFDGFRGASLAKLDDGSYVFIGNWAKREHCERAMEQAQNVGAITAFLSHVTEDIGMEFGEIVDVDGRVETPA